MGRLQARRGPGSERRTLPAVAGLRSVEERRSITPWNQNCNPLGPILFSALVATAPVAVMLEIWPAIVVTGVSFAGPQFLVSNYHGLHLVDVIAALVSMACLTGFLRLWHPPQIWPPPR